MILGTKRVKYGRQRLEIWNWVRNISSEGRASTRIPGSLRRGQIFRDWREEAAFVSWSPAEVNGEKTKNLNRCTERQGENDPKGKQKAHGKIRLIQRHVTETQIKLLSLNPASFIRGSVSLNFIHKRAVCV